MVFENVKYYPCTSFTTLHQVNVKRKQFDSNWIESNGMELRKYVFDKFEI